MELPLVSAENVIVMLLQRGVNVVDNNDEIHVRDPRVAQTIAFYAQLVAGPRTIGVESSGGLEESRAGFSGMIGEIVNGLPARVWSYAATGRDSHWSKTTSACVRR